MRHLQHNNYEIINSSWETRSSWGHESKLYRDDLCIASHKVSYCNRTWESYQYRSCMQALVHQVIDGDAKQAVQDYKRENNIKRLKSDVRTEIERKVWAEHELKPLYDKI